jgi:hypothetical protein
VSAAAGGFGFSKIRARIHEIRHEYEIRNTRAGWYLCNIAKLDGKGISVQSQYQMEAVLNS